jgi:hypothetical protein
MCDHAWAWAEALQKKTGKKKIRTNEVHGEEEIRCVLNERFELADLETEETDRTGSFAMQEGSNPLPSVSPIQNPSCEFSSQLPPASRTKMARCWKVTFRQWNLSRPVVQMVQIQPLKPLICPSA